MREGLTKPFLSRKLELLADESLAPILILVGYLGNAASFLSRAETRKIHGHLCTATVDSQLIHTPCRESRCDHETRPDFLLLDLRSEVPNRIDVLGEASGGGVPLVILTTADLDAAFSEFCDQRGAWRMIEPVSTEAVQAWSGILNLRRRILEESATHRFLAVLPQSSVVPNKMHVSWMLGRKER